MARELLDVYEKRRIGKRGVRFWDVRRVGGLEKCGHRNARGGREQTKPKINALHLLGQFVPSVGRRTWVYLPSPRVDLFQDHS